MRVLPGPWFLALLALSPLVLRADTFTYSALVQRLTDLDWLADKPHVGERTAMASSYDRHSQYDAAQDKYIAWGANGDGSGVVRMEGEEAVLADIQGPGCIDRMWSAQPRQGHVKFYLDGSAAPAIDLPFLGYFDGTSKPFDRPSLVYNTGGPTRDGGWNNFTPIAFQKSCKIVADPGWGQYYQFTYTQFSAGTVVPTFHLDLAAEDFAALDKADALLGQCGQNPTGARPGEKTENEKIQVEAGATAKVIELAGPEAITALRVNFDLPADANTGATLLRQLAIQITWDGDKAPAVWAPLGDFFTTIFGAQPQQSLPMGQLADGTYYAYWYMPFASRAKIEVINDSPQASPWSGTFRTRRWFRRSGSSSGSMRNGIAMLSCPPARTARWTGRCWRRRGRAATWGRNSTSGIRAAGGGARVTTSSSSTARSFPPVSAPARRIISAWAGA